MGDIDIVLIAHGILSSQKSCELHVEEALADIKTNALTVISLLTIIANFFEEKHTGTIAISGLVRDANIKITDVSGNLVYSTVANGGTAVWNGNLFSGQRAATGVYLVFCTNADGSQTQVTKILFIN